jgi:L-histidine Nalpha-methyltransferase
MGITFELMTISQHVQISRSAKTNSTKSQVSFKYLINDCNPDEIDVTSLIAGLSQTSKSISSNYFYDELGSQLFEQITDLPEYYPTRTESLILQKYAAEIVSLTGECELVELGSGSSTKTRILLDAYGDRNLPLKYIPIDISSSILETSSKQLAIDYRGLEIYGMIGTYEMALKHLPISTLPTRMISFLGSTLGNFNPDEYDAFCDRIANVLQPGEYFLLGVDLQKPLNVLEAAYNDSLGVTAAFNLNLLSHLNHRFEANFDLSQFEHLAFYHKEQHQIEMHLRSLSNQNVYFKSLAMSVDLKIGETIRTEISRKFNLKHLAKDLEKRGFRPIKSWSDSNHWYGLALFQILPLH